jgi:hypothetical protein
VHRRSPLPRFKEAIVSRRTYGILASVVGSALGAWWWTRERAAQTTAEPDDRGTVIFRNTPTPPPYSEEGII